MSTRRDEHGVGIHRTPAAAPRGTNNHLFQYEFNDTEPGAREPLRSSIPVDDEGPRRVNDEGPLREKENRMQQPSKVEENGGGVKPEEILSAAYRRPTLDAHTATVFLCEEGAERKPLRVLRMEPEFQNGRLV